MKKIILLVVIASAVAALWSWWSWHGDQQAIRRVVSEAINERDVGDYVKAAGVIRTSSLPPAVKQYQLGQLIVGDIMENARKG